MSHYFIEDENLQDEERQLSFSINGKEFSLFTNTGLFSKDKLDTGSRILLETVLTHQKQPNSLLDLGCGMGTLSVVLSSFWNCACTAIDVNPRAVEYTKKNLEPINKQATVLCQDGIETGKFDCIVFNPPIRAGKKVIYSLLNQCKDHCSGNLWIVIRKNHGAQSLVNYLEEIGMEVQRVHREKGYWILKANRAS